MKKSCFVCPVHPPKYHFAEQLVQSYNNFYEDSDLFLVFSTVEERLLFEELTLNKNLNYKSIIFSETLNDYPITQKKFFGLQYVFENTDFEKVGVIDCDSVFIKTVDYDFLFDEFYEKKKIYGTTLTEHGGVLPPGAIRTITSSPLPLFSEEDQNDIILKTNDLSLYFWFNNIPIYEKTNFKNFIEYIDYDGSKLNPVGLDFDFIVYCYFLMIKDLIVLEDMNFEIELGFLEEQKNIHVEIFVPLFQKIEPFWLTKPEYLPEEMLKNVFIKFHVDRL